MPTKRTCPQGHVYYKSSDCPTCPVCERERQPGAAFMAALSAPAKRALENQGITSPELLSGYTERELLQLHGIGPASLPALRDVLKQAGLSFRNT